MKTFTLRFICQESGTVGGTSAWRCPKCKKGLITADTFKCDNCGYKQ